MYAHPAWMAARLRLSCMLRICSSPTTPISLALHLSERPSPSCNRPRINRRGNIFRLDVRLPHALLHSHNSVPNRITSHRIDSPRHSVITGFASLPLIIPRGQRAALGPLLEPQPCDASRLLISLSEMTLLSFSYPQH